MNKFWILFLFAVVFSVSLAPILFENTLAQEITPPRKQWKQVPDLETLTCKSGMLLLQKSDGSPACVLPSTYLKLVDRKYGQYDSELFTRQPGMIDTLLSDMVSNQNMMQHWHDMMIQYPKTMQQTMNTWIPKMKDDPTFFKKFMDPMISDPNLREKMITEMKKHPIMNSTLSKNPKWMHSVNEKTGTGMGSHMGQKNSHTMQHGMSFHNQNIMMDMIHHMWVTNSTRDKMAEFMLENPNHMNMMTDQMMGQILYPMMDDPQLRQQMIDVMLENHKFMNSQYRNQDNP